ncbi:hypothetical protein H7849_16620 [Alloacidobacterium dinghuense]|uniref:Uncharacterized protein n=1 Tax=Alloacidobacterium dinghuense TaxID=2763107 RepID=A0A7G8BDW7_9BACT|nr:hypothetical protein [Alloacidobacterium dinghuense]QNI30737.1 hypothetical protein H7849_16620 [Alloacidobacterium dinghuense]
MSRVRGFAKWLLEFVLRSAPRHCEQWARAMLHELDFIEGDWAALFWALGSVAAIFRHCGRELVRMGFRRREEADMKETAKNVGWVFAGVVLSAVLVVCAAMLFHLAEYFYPPMNQSIPWPTWLVVFFLPETLFVIGTVRLWHKRKPMAVGVLLAALIFATHFAMHIVSHFRG